MTGKILTIIFSVILIAALAFAITWGIINWSKVEEGMKGNGLYTQEDINNAYQDGYDTALKDKDEYDILISEYRDTITTLTDKISQLNSEISALNRTNSSLELQITNLTTLKEELEEQLEKMTSESTENAVTIADLNRQILALNTEIESLRLQVQNHSAVVTTLNKTIADLQATIEYYEQYIATLETGETVVATFEFDGKVYSIQVVAKGSTVTIADPPSTEGVIFNGWTVDGHPVTLAEYPIYSNTKFVADVAYKYVVNFTVDGVVKSTQLVEKGGYVETPTSPKKANYTFKYWTLDGNLEVTLDKYPINCDTTFIAKFARLYTVTFQYEDGREIVSRRIEEGTTTNPPRITDLDEGAVINGWKVDGYYVDVANHAINQDTVFVADITYYYTVLFMVNDAVYKEVKVQKGHKIEVPDNPTETQGKTFIGWTLDGEEIVDVDSFTVTESMTFIAKCGVWYLLNGSRNFYSTGNSSINSIDLYIWGLKAGDQFRITVSFLDVNIDDELDNGYWFNATDGRGCYGWNYAGDGNWSAKNSSGNYDGAFGGAMELFSDTPFTSVLGMKSYNTPNQFTITLTCTQDNYLTIEWSDDAGFYIESISMWYLYVLR